MSDASHPAMDYDAHKEMYERFNSITKIVVGAVANILVALVLFAFGGALSNWTGALIVILLVITSFIGLFAGPRGWIPLAFVFVLGLALVVLTVG